MNRIGAFYWYSVLGKLRRVFAKSVDEKRKYLQKAKLIQGKSALPAEEANQYIAQRIKEGKAFMTARFGGFELFAVRAFDFEVESRYKTALHFMCFNAGFFPGEEEQGKKFKDLMLECIPLADVMGIWMQPLEEYYLNQYGNEDLVTTYLLDLDPLSAPEAPWSAALEGKKVLVIHPFVETIRKQYKIRERIFPGTNILPEFELKTLKAVQTMAGEKDERFDTWFNALEWMYSEAMKIDFDVAIIGCGAYGYPLAAKLKKAGKQAIHLGGATQLLFGIKGRRWEESDDFAYVQKFFNDAWVYPSEEDRPKQADKIEGGCYW